MPHIIIILDEEGNEIGRVTPPHEEEGGNLTNDETNVVVNLGKIAERLNEKRKDARG